MIGYYVLLGVIWLALAVPLFQWARRVHPGSYGWFLGLVRPGLLLWAYGEHQVGRDDYAFWFLLVFVLTLWDNGKESVVWQHLTSKRHQRRDGHLHQGGERHNDTP